MNQAVLNKSSVYINKQLIKSINITDILDPQAILHRRNYTEI